MHQRNLKIVDPSVDVLNSYNEMGSRLNSAKQGNSSITSKVDKTTSEEGMEIGTINEPIRPYNLVKTPVWNKVKEDARPKRKYKMKQSEEGKYHYSNKYSQYSKQNQRSLMNKSAKNIGYLNDSSYLTIKENRSVENASNHKK